ncbi:MAG: Gfo/Idh/MocA family oxidoreductase [Bacteroidales bacterium]|nr:Gfo/Idh/MocA family oxidoreductase [Bacteroidales bacterium]
MINALIDRYKKIRNYRSLRQTFDSSFAFVGIGSHSTQNLYPAIDYLHIPLKYIGCTDPAKVPLIENKFGVRATTSLDEILADEAVKGVFISVTPKAHFELASKVLGARKCLFIEKPPCRNSSELEKLLSLEKKNGVFALAGLQRRYAPAIQILRKELKHASLISYHLHYSVGLYPEGDSLLDLFIHPLDELCNLFGEAEILSQQKIDSGKGAETLLLMLRHKGITGTVELTTSGSWTAARECLEVNTKGGLYTLTDVEKLTLTKHPSSFAGIPSEKIFKKGIVTVELFNPAHTVPVVANNQIATQGFLSEIETFATLVCNQDKATSAQSKSGASNFSSLESLRPTYKLLDAIL